jgi:hypothetical protein
MAKKTYDVWDNEQGELFENVRQWKILEGGALSFTDAEGDLHVLGPAIPWKVNENTADEEDDALHD